MTMFEQYRDGGVFVIDEVDRPAPLAVTVKGTYVEGRECAVANVTGEHGTFTDAFARIDLAQRWATDVLVAYFGLAFFEADALVRAHTEVVR